MESYGQHVLRQPEAAEKLHTLGLIVVEGPNVVISLDALGVPAVAICSNTITGEQAEKAPRLAIQLGGGIVTLMLDCDPEGENGVKQVFPTLAELIAVRLSKRRRRTSACTRGGHRVWGGGSI